MRVVVAPDKFKGCLDAAQAAHAIAIGLTHADPNLQVDLCPMADGGEGTVHALVAATSGIIEKRLVTGPLPHITVPAPFGILGDGQTAVIEMAAASGLHLLQQHQRNPLLTTTYGTGQLIMAAVESGASRIILGIGGSATNDAGLGCAQACGALIQLDDGTRRTHADQPLCGRDLPHVSRVELDWRQHPPITVACDVTNPLYGPTGAATVFAPQKGADNLQVRQLDHALHHLARRLRLDELATTPGAGAAGGLGFGMLAFFHAKLQSGVQIVMETVRLPQRLLPADLCITAEGKLDAQSLAGKTPVGVARLCRQIGIPCVALAGAIDHQAEDALHQEFNACWAICDRPMDLQTAIHDTPRLLTASARNLMQVIRLARQIHSS